MKKPLNKKKFIFKTINGIKYISVDVHNEIFDGFVKKLKAKFPIISKENHQVHREIDKIMGEFKDE